MTVKHSTLNLLLPPLSTNINGNFAVFKLIYHWRRHTEVSVVYFCFVFSEFYYLEMENNHFTDGFLYWTWSGSINACLNLTLKTLSEVSTVYFMMNVWSLWSSDHNTKILSISPHGLHKDDTALHCKTDRIPFWRGWNRSLRSNYLYTLNWFNCLDRPAISIASIELCNTESNLVLGVKCNKGNYWLSREPRCWGSVF